MTIEEAKSEGDRYTRRRLCDMFMYYSMMSDRYHREAIAIANSSLYFEPKRRIARAQGDAWYWHECARACREAIVAWDRARAQ